MTTTLKARIDNESRTVSVYDTTDGISVWTPDEAATAAILSSDDPKAAAVEMCETQPMRGRWAS